MNTPAVQTFQSAPSTRCEIAIVRSLLTLLEDSLAASDMRGASDLADQLAEHLRRIDEGA